MLKKNRYISLSLIISTVMLVALLSPDIFVKAEAPDTIPNLLLEYTFSGDMSDSSGNGYHGISSNPPMLTEDYKEDPNSACYFNSLQYIENEDIPDFGAGNFTVALWFNADEYSNASYMIGKSTSAYEMQTAARGFIIGLRLVGGDKRLFAQVRGDNGHKITSVPINTGNWHFTSLVKNSDNVTLYLDGEVVYSSDFAVGDASAPGKNLSLGMYTSGAQPYKGFMDDVRIYNTALTTEELSLLYNEGLPTNLPPQITEMTVAPQSGQAPIEVDFNAAATDTEDVSLNYKWDFGDGSGSYEQNPSHIYRVPGVYTASVTVTDSGGRTDRKTTYVKVNGDDLTAVNALSCSRQDVLAAISMANDADTVLVPAGSAYWDEAIVLTKSIKLAGAGIDKTIIIRGNDDPDHRDFLIKINPADPASAPWIEVTGFTLDANLKGACISVDTNYNHAYYNFRIHHNKLKNTLDDIEGSRCYMSIRVEGNSFGLIDNNQFENNQYDFKIYGNNQNTWDLFPGPDNIGSENYLYIENNSSVNPHAIILSSGEGARWVYRYNTIDLSVRGYGAFDAHGNTNNDGVVANELYGNTLINVADRTDGFKFHDHRGGTGIIFDNVASGNETGARIDVREEDGKKADCQYPGEDPITDTYLWNNVYNNNPMRIYAGGNDYIDMVLEDRDFWDDYGEDDNNFSYGLSSERPTTCAANDCYWETDTRKLYRCKTENIWSFVYSPYTYPHPLSQVKEPGDVNDNPGIDIGDLSKIAGLYGKKSEDTGWDTIRHMDINDDGEIGFYELAFIARRLLLN